MDTERTFLLLLSVVACCCICHSYCNYCYYYYCRWVSYPSYPQTVWLSFEFFGQACDYLLHSYNSSPNLFGHNFGNEGNSESSHFFVFIHYFVEMATHGKMSSFDPNKEQWTRLDFSFEANNVTSAETKRAIFLTVCGPTTFQLLRSLVQPSTPKEKSYTQLKECLEKHFNPKLSLIVEHFKFNTRIRKIR